MFTANDFYDFVELPSCDKQHFAEMERTTNNGKILRFNDRKINLCYNVVLYHKFLRSDDTTKALANDPQNWDYDDFETWRDRGRHPNAASIAALIAGTGTTNTVTTAATPPTPTKKAEDAWLSWQRSKRDAEKTSYFAE